MPTVKIYGYGWVGRSILSLFPAALRHDPAQGFISNEKADVAFICVPTPLKDGQLDTSIVEQIARESLEDLIIIRSTVSPGTCERLQKLGKEIVYQPEYLGETVAHPLFNESQTPFMILGGLPEA